MWNGACFAMWGQTCSEYDLNHHESMWMFSSDFFHAVLVAALRHDTHRFGKRVRKKRLCQDCRGNLLLFISMPKKKVWCYVRCFLRVPALAAMVSL